MLGGFDDGNDIQMQDFKAAQHDSDRNLTGYLEGGPSGTQGSLTPSRKSGGKTINFMIGSGSNSHSSGELEPNSSNSGPLLEEYRD